MKTRESFVMGAIYLPYLCGGVLREVFLPTRFAAVRVSFLSAAPTDCPFLTRSYPPKEEYRNSVGLVQYIN